MITYSSTARDLRTAHPSETTLSREELQKKKKSIMVHIKDRRNLGFLGQCSKSVTSKKAEMGIMHRKLKKTKHELGW